MPLYNPLTGNKRRRPTFETAKNKRSIALDAEDRRVIGLAEKEIEHLYKAMMLSLLYMILCLLLAVFEIVDGEQEYLLIEATTALSQLINNRINQLLDYITDIVDIEEGEEPTRGQGLKPRIHLSFVDFDGADDTKDETNITVPELTLLINFFQLNQAADVDGFIRIEGYVFRPQEILLFACSKLKHGLPNTKICKYVFGGDARKWTYALRWFYLRADGLITEKIDLRLLDSFRGHFTHFAEKISNLIRQGFQVEHEDGELVIQPGIDYNDHNNPFCIFGFLDCSNFRTSTPGTGPRGRYEGAGRREDHDEIQRCVYN